MLFLLSSGKPCFSVNTQLRIIPCPQLHVQAMRNCLKCKIYLQTCHSCPSSAMFIKECMLLLIHFMTFWDAKKNVSQINSLILQQWVNTVLFILLYKIQYSQRLYIWTQYIQQFIICTVCTVHMSFC